MKHLTKIIKPYELTKKAMTDMVAVLKNAVEQGDIDPLVLDAQCKWMEDVMKKIRSVIKQDAVRESYNYNKEETVQGCKLIRTSSPTTYDLKADAEYSRLYDLLKVREGELREAAKLNEKGGVYVSKRTGEVVDPPPIKSGGAEYIRFDFPKA